MTEQKEEPTLLLHQEAWALTDAVEDKRLQAFIRYGITTACFGRGMKPGVVPQMDFDLLFFAEVLRAMGDDCDALLCILQGDISTMEWWPDG